MAITELQAQKRVVTPKAQKTVEFNHNLYYQSRLFVKHCEMMGFTICDLLNKTEDHPMAQVASAHLLVKIPAKCSYNCQNL